MWTATNRAQIDAWVATLAAIERHGERPFESLSSADVAARTGSARHLAGVFEAGSATVQPALLARGLRRVALERGVRIFEGSPMVSLDHEHGEGGDLELVSYLEDPTVSTVIRRGELVLEGSRYLDETGETDGWGEPIRQPPPGGTSAQHNPMLRGARPE